MKIRVRASYTLVILRYTIVAMGQRSNLGYFVPVKLLGGISGCMT